MLTIAISANVVRSRILTVESRTSLKTFRMPQVVSSVVGVSYSSATFLGGTSILIVVAVALDLVDRMNAQLLMRNYEGFMKGTPR